MTDERCPAVGAGGRSTLGAGTRITGELRFPGAVELSGNVVGSVDASAVVITKAGEVEGEVRAASVTIGGRFDGRVIGGEVALQAGARVTGDVAYESLTIESGAQVEGTFRSRPYAKDAEPVDQAKGSSAE